MNELGRILAKYADTPSMIRKEYLVQAYNLGKDVKQLIYFSFVFIRNIKFIDKDRTINNIEEEKQDLNEK